MPHLTPPQTRTKPRRALRAMALVLAGGFIAAACGGGAEPSADGEPTTVQIVEIPGLAQMLYPHIADEEGFFEDHGIKPEFVSAQSGPALVTSILGGNAQIGMAGPQLIWPAMKKGEDILAMAAAAQLNYLIASCDSDVPTPNRDAAFPANIADLKGKRLGTIAEGTQTERFGLELIKAADMQPGKDVEVLYVGAAGTAIPACDAGRIDFYVFNPPAQALLGEEGKDYEVVADALAPSSGGLFDGLISDLYATTRTYAESNPEQVSGFCEAVTDAKEFASDPKNSDQVVAYLAKFTNIPKARAQEIWESDFPQSLLNPVDEKTWAQQAEALEGELADYVPDYNKHVDSGCTDIVGG